MFAFVGVVFAVIGLIHLYLWKRLVRDTVRPGRWRRIGAVSAVLLALLVPATLIGVRTGAVEWLAWPGYLWLALMFYLLVVLAVLEIPRLGLQWWLRRTAAARTPEPAGAAAGSAGSAGSGFDLGLGSAPAGGGIRPGPSLTGGPSGAQTEAGIGSRAEVGAGAEVRTGAAGVDRQGVDRRLLLARGAAIFAGLTAAGITGYGVRTALGPPRLDRVQLPLAKLPRAMDGTRLAVVSDIHLGPLTGPDHVRRIVDLINSVDADVVAIVGDLVDGSVAELGPGAAALADIRSRQGAYFVTGNHEYYSGFQEWVDEVARLGVRPLRNERLEITTRGGAFDLAGVNDPGGAAFGDAPDFAKALGGRDPSRPVVLMAHQPVVARDAAGYGVDLQVSGHTHGGQMAPFNLLVKLQQPVVSGLGTVDGVPVYVTNGAGFWGPPVRVGAPPQVTLLELRTRS